MAGYFFSTNKNTHQPPSQAIGGKKKRKEEKRKKCLDFCDEYVISEWSSSNAFAKSIKSLKRRIIKWKLPVGAKIKVTGRYVGDEYEFIVTK